MRWARTCGIRRFKVGRHDFHGHVGQIQGHRIGLGFRRRLRGHFPMAELPLLFRNGLEDHRPHRLEGREHVASTMAMFSTRTCPACCGETTTVRSVWNFHKVRGHHARFVHLVIGVQRFGVGTKRVAVPRPMRERPPFVGVGHQAVHARSWSRHWVVLQGQAVQHHKPTLWDTLNMTSSGGRNPKVRHQVRVACERQRQQGSLTLAMVTSPETTCQYKKSRRRSSASRRLALQRSTIR